LLALPAFRDGDFTTKLIEEQAEYWKKALREAGGNNDDPTLAAVLGVVAANHQPTAPIVDGAATGVRPSLWYEMARREGLE
jgi:hypothetical protein